MDIFLDTNFLVYCAKQKLDFTREIERIFPKSRLFLLSSVKDELKNLLKTEKGRSKETVELALQIVDNLKSRKLITEKKSEGDNADDALVGFDNANSIIATMDKELKERFKNAKILTIRQKRYLFLS
jgi:rRNA-processing protein FCF1